MKKRKQPNPKFHVGDKVHCLTIDLYGRKLTVKSSRYIDFLGCHVYTLEDETGQLVYRGNHVSNEVPEQFLKSAESILERYIRLQKSFSTGVYYERPTAITESHQGQQIQGDSSEETAV